MATCGCAGAEPRGSQRCLRTVHSEPGLVRVGGAEVVGDDTLVAALVPKGDAAEVQDGGVLHHLPILCPHVGKVLHVSVGQDLTVLLPGKGHGGAAAAGCRAREPDVPAHHGHRRLWLDDDLWLWQVLWGEKSHCYVTRPLGPRGTGCRSTGTARQLH